MNKIVFLIICMYVAVPDLHSQTTKTDNKGNLQIVGSNGELLEYHLLNTEGVMRPPPALAKRVYKYDSTLRLVLESYHQANGKLYQYSDGVAMRKYTHNSENYEVIMECYDSAKTRTTDKSIGASITCTRYYPQTKLVREIIYFDADSARVINNEGHARGEFQYDPFIEARYYDDKDTLIQYFNEDMKYLSRLQLLGSSIPRWLRSAKQNNRVDGVHFKSFQYDLTLKNQSFDGAIQYYVRLLDGDVQEIKCLKSENIPDKITIKTTKALRTAYFLSLSALKARPVEGQMRVYFKSSQ